MKYRIESIHIPETGGIAHPGDSNDQNRELKGRRIVHVLEVSPTVGGGGVSARVLTEETD
jgi:hypothetical protein